MLRMGGLKLGFAQLCPLQGRKIQSKEEAETRELHPRLLRNSKAHRVSSLKTHPEQEQSKSKVRAALLGKAQQMF